MKPKKIGVFVCWCGLNIASTVDVNRVVEEIRKYPGVEYAVNYQYMCSDPGQSMIKDAIKDRKLDGFIVAACTHTLHENTYRKLAVSAGLNPYNLEIANIREHCSWVHTDKEKATKKAVRIIKSIVDKLSLNIELTSLKIPVTERVLVIGGGITGMQTAIDIASAGHDVIILDRKSSVGGRMSQLSETFPTLDCTQCIMTPKMVEVGQNPNIRLLTYSEVEEVSGYVGNFNVKIKKKPTYIDWTKCTGCGECERYCRTRYLMQVPAPVDWKFRLSKDELAVSDSIIGKYNAEKMHLISILHDIQAHFNYLPKPVLGYISQRLEVPLSRVYHVATFYTAFSLEPRGKKHIKVCTGTSCHVRGAPKVLDEVKSALGIKEGETTKDREYSLETVACIGCCALSPCMMVNKEVHAKLSPTKVRDIFGKSAVAVSPTAGGVSA